MQVSLKYGVSAVAILAAVSFAHAQTNERQGSEKSGGAAEHMQGERGGGQPQRQGGAASERGKGAAAERGATPREGGQAAQRETTQKRDSTAESGRQNAQEEKAARDERQSPGHRTAKAGQNSGTAEQGQEQQNSNGNDNKRDGQGRENRQRQSNAAGATKGSSGVTGESGRSEGRRVNFHVSAPQKTELHNIAIHDSGIRVYHRGDIHFATNVGERIPDTIEFYSPPARFVEVDPEFQDYKIIVLDNEILVVDPETREIVDIIEI